MRNGKKGPHDGFGTADWDLQRMRATERAMIMRSQGFIHPATLVPDELEYNKAKRLECQLQSKFRDLEEIMNGKSKATATRLMHKNRPKLAVVNIEKSSNHQFQKL